MANKGNFRGGGFELYVPNFIGNRVDIMRRGELPKDMALPEPDIYRIEERFAKCMAMNELLSILPDLKGCEALFAASKYGEYVGAGKDVVEFPFALLKLML